MKKCQLCNIEIQNKPGSGRPRKYCATCAVAVVKQKQKNRWTKTKEEYRQANAGRMREKRQYLKNSMPLFHLSERQKATALEAERRKDERVRARENFLVRTRKPWLKVDYTSDYWRNKRHILRAKAYGVLWEKVPIKAMFEMASNCHWCKQPLVKKTIDHIIDLSRGGGHLTSNCVVSCLSCNSQRYFKKSTDQSTQPTPAPLHPLAPSSVNAHQ